jgi:putative sigma-54 modulation protein
MKISIKATKIELTDELKNYIQKKMDMLDKYLGSFKAIKCEVEVGLAVGGQKSGKIYRAAVNLDLPGELLRVEKTEKVLQKAIDKTKDHLEIMIKKYKEKKFDRKKGKV